MSPCNLDSSLCFIQPSISHHYVPAVVSDSANAFFHLSSPGSPVGHLTKEEISTQKIKYLKYRSEIQTQFYLVSNPNFGINLLS